MEKEEVKLTKMVGGGTSWYYAMWKGKVLGASHEDDKEGMAKLRKIKQEGNKDGNM